MRAPPAWCQRAAWRQRGCDMPLAVRIFRGLLWLYPAEFRDHFGRDMCLTLADRLRAEDHSSRALAAWSGAAAAVLIHAPKEHYYMIRQDVIYALRAMRREKLSTVIAILVLALGIGSTTAIFTLVNGVLLRPLPFPAQDRLVYVEEGGSGIKIGRGAVAFPNYLDLRSRNHALEDLAVYTSGTIILRGDSEAERVPAGFVSASIFPVLRVRPLVGRGFNEEED